MQRIRWQSKELEEAFEAAKRECRKARLTIEWVLENFP